jgi:thiol-disulfide isomerase/thioredoxin
MWRLFDTTLVGKRAPDIGGEQWFNIDGLPAPALKKAQTGEPLRFSEDLKGYVVIVHFWDYACINCIHTLPYLVAWWRRYRESRFLIIGVHTPEFEAAKDPENVESAILRFDLEYPVVTDPDYTTWHRYRNKVWPRDVIVDQQGIIQYDHRGEGAYAEKEAVLQQLLSVPHVGS